MRPVHVDPHHVHNELKAFPGTQRYLEVEGAASLRSMPSASRSIVRFAYPLHPPSGKTVMLVSSIDFSAVREANGVRGMAEEASALPPCHSRLISRDGVRRSW